MEKMRYSNAELGAFCTALAHLLRAGINCGDALNLLAQDGGEGPLFSCLPRMARMADEGWALSRVLEQAGGFPAYVHTLVRAGEETGNLEEALMALGGHYEQQEQLERELRGALSYPLLLLGVLLVVLTALLVWVLPVFDEVYRQLGSSLTGIAGGLLALGRLMGKYGVVILVLLGLGTAGLAALSRRKGVKAGVLYRLDGGWRGDLTRSRLAGVLAMGLRSGLDGERALLLAEGLAGEDAELARRWRHCLDRLRGQDSLPAALRESGLLPAAECRLLEAGVHSGCVDAVMEKVAARMRERGQAQLEQRLGRIEPALVLTAAALVGSILLCVLLPLTRIMAAIG